ncbi:MAG: hypothetical protein B6229_09070 [Spirochaetaceae bacterium 4572_7]|nr:MAG: hypothetical protein B6229_09070 [Spirochaetaceae bacterium 4572_7]
MISVSDFLFIYYDKGTFIINRNQFSASVSLDQEQPLDRPIKQFNSFIRYNNYDIAIFDLDDYLKSSFKVESINSTRLSIISKLSLFSSNLKDILIERLFCNNSNLTDEYIAFSITSNSEITPSPISRFKLLSKVLIPKQRENGILSCSFHNSKIEYFIDLESFIYRILEQQEDNL